MCPALRRLLRNGRCCSSGLEDLCFDSRSRGNKARFMNCAWGRCAGLAYRLAVVF
jgi:hypothetical protein